MRHLKSRIGLSAIGLLLAGGLVIAQLGDLPNISGQIEFGSAPAEQLEAIVGETLEEVEFRMAFGDLPQVQGIKMWRGTQADLRPRLEGVQGFQRMGAPQMMMTSGQPAEMGMDQRVQVKLPTPGLSAEDPDTPIEEISLTVPMRVTLTGWLAADDPESVAAMRLQAEYGTVFAHHGAGSLPMIGKMAFDTVLDFSEPEVDTYLVSWQMQPGQAMVMIVTAKVAEQ